MVGSTVINLSGLLVCGLQARPPQTPRLVLQRLLHILSIYNYLIRLGSLELDRLRG